MHYKWRLILEIVGEKERKQREDKEMNRGSVKKNYPSFLHTKQQVGVAYKIKCYDKADEKLNSEK